jgi:hypothetical protein
MEQGRGVQGEGYVTWYARMGYGLRVAGCELRVRG